MAGLGGNGEAGEGENRGRRESRRGGATGTPLTRLRRTQCSGGAGRNYPGSLRRTNNDERALAACRALQQRTSKFNKRARRGEAARKKPKENGGVEVEVCFGGGVSAPASAMCSLRGEKTKSKNTFRRFGFGLSFFTPPMLLKQLL